MIDQLAARNDPAGVVHQVGEQPVLVAGELDRLAVDADPSGARVELYRADHQLVGGVSGRAAQQRAQPGEHLLHVEGLADVIVGAGVEPGDLVAPTVARGENQHRHGAARLAPGLEHRDAVAFGQPEVEHDGVVGFGVAEVPALFAVEGAVDGVARPFQSACQLAIEVAIIFDNEQAHFWASDLQVFGAGSWPWRGSSHLPVSAFIVTCT